MFTHVYTLVFLSCSLKSPQAMPRSSSNSVVHHRSPHEKNAVLHICIKTHFQTHPSFILLVKYLKLLAKVNLIIYIIILIMGFTPFKLLVNRVYSIQILGNPTNVLSDGPRTPVSFMMDQWLTKIRGIRSSHFQSHELMNAA